MGLPFSLDPWAKNPFQQAKTPDISKLTTLLCNKRDRPKEKKPSPHQRGRQNSVLSPLGRTAPKPLGSRPKDAPGKTKLKCLVKSVEEVNGRIRTRSTM